LRVPASPDRRNVFQSSSEVLIEPTPVTPKPSRICCAFANVDEHAVDDLTAGRRLSLRSHSGCPHRRAIGDQGMAIDSLQDDRAIRHDSVEIGGGGELLGRPQLLVPAGALNPLHIRVRGCVIAQPLLKFGEGPRSHQVEL
jgi:hypothetical protein